MAHKETCNKTKISVISSRYLVILKTHLSNQKWGSSNLNGVKICASHTYLFVCFFFSSHVFRTRFLLTMLFKLQGTAGTFPPRMENNGYALEKKKLFLLFLNNRTREDPVTLL